MNKKIMYKEFFTSFLRRLRRDSGSVMVTVLIIMLVLTLGGVGVAAIVMNTAPVGVKNGVRLSVHAVVDGGIAEQTAELMARRLVCDSSEPPVSGVGNISGHPYSWNVYCQSTNDYGDEGREYLYLQVSAQVEDESVARRVQFTYKLAPQAANSGDMVPGVVFFGQSDFAKGNFDTGFANSGNFTSKCDTTFTGDFVNRGNINVGDNCKVGGRLISIEGEIQGNGGQIAGDVIANGNINLRQNSKIGGSVYSINGEVKLENDTRVTANVRAKHNITLYGQSKIYGHAYSTDGSLQTDSGWHVGGNIIQGGNGDAPPIPPINIPPLPVLPDWYKYQFDLADWPGYSVRVLANGPESNPYSCQHYNNGSGQGWKDLKNFTDPMVIDARACERLKSDHGGITVELKTNIVLLASQFDLGRTNFQAHSASAGEPYLWIVSEDTDPGGTPPYGGKMIKIDKTNFYDSIRTMVYTPYKVQITEVSEFTGQIYGGDWDGGGGNGLNFHYKPILLPGMTASTGGIVGGSVIYVPGGDIVAGSWQMLSAAYIPVP